jgi:hypothetical protein
VTKKEAIIENSTAISGPTKKLKNIKNYKSSTPNNPTNKRKITGCFI